MTYLDMTHQIEVLDLLYQMNVQENRTIVMVLHDINLACRYADHIVAIREGKVAAQGRPAEIITAELMKTVFSLDCEIISDPFYGTPLCIPRGQARSAPSLPAPADAV